MKVLPIKLQVIREHVTLPKKKEEIKFNLNAVSQQYHKKISTGGGTRTHTPSMGIRA